jgi:pimeloyl-ACP methyl ester carboxylesterase
MSGFPKTSACVFLVVLLSSCHTQKPHLTPDCSNVTFQGIAGLTVISADQVSDREDLPPFCAIKGTIEPNIGFEARFPLQGWNGKYYQSGCGGYCGSVRPDKKGYSNTINPALKKGYATITTDAGHQAYLGDASWAKNNPVALEVYAHRTIPLTYQAGTAMVDAYYGEPANLDYFSGCSNGGRMAAMAAQRYPELFDGILAGGSILNLSQNGGLHGSWVVQSNSDLQGERILNRQNFAHKLPVLEQEINKQCDASDGQNDGVISTPRNCDVDVGKLPRCTGVQDEICFTDQERQVLEKWYRGPTDSAGIQLYPGMPAGSERYWLLWFLDGETQDAPGNALGGDYTKYMGFENGAADDYTALDFDFDTDPQRLVANGKLLNSMDSDLSQFRESGGKFLMYHGWSDPLVLPDQSVEYYQRLVVDTGGREATDEFFKLFMIPGMGHCWEIPSAAPDRFDPITALENWVEKDQAPTHLSATALDPTTAPLPAAAICPYPASPVYLDSESDLADENCAIQP